MYRKNPIFEHSIPKTDWCHKIKNVLYSNLNLGIDVPNQTKVSISNSSTKSNSNKWEILNFF